MPAPSVAAREQTFHLLAEGGADNVWIVEVGDASVAESFADFVAAVSASEPSVTRDEAGFTVGWTSPTSGEVTFGSTAALADADRRHRCSVQWAILPPPLLTLRRCLTMALDAAHRSSIYHKLIPMLGEEDANVLMSEFPSIEADELVTKDFLRAELALTRGELRGEIADVRGEIAEVRTDIAGVRTELAALESRLTVRLGSAMAAATALLVAVGWFT